MTQSKRKHEAGDRWGLVCIYNDTGETRRVQIAGWESSTFPYQKQAQEYADSYNAIALQFNKGRRYEIRFAGNYKKGIGPGYGWV